MNAYDYIIVGAGSSGCVLANRLSEDPANNVLLIEAGPKDSNPLIHLPKGYGKTLGNEKIAWHFETEPGEYNGHQPERWVRGKTLGGSSSVNGMIYNRGDPQEYDKWEKLGASGWGWSGLESYFKRMEDHELGADDLRGAGGPVHISQHPDRTPLCDAIVEAGMQMGLKQRDDPNRLDQEGVGYFPRTIKKGRRVSAADAFLKPAKRRRNLTIETNTLVDKLILEDGRAAGVSCRKNGALVEFQAGKEIILAAGAIQSPKLLQLSGIGPADHLRMHNIDVVSDSPGVGTNMREHRVITLQYRLTQPVSHNREFSGARMIANGIKGMLFGKGVLSYGAFEVGAFIKTRPDLARPDAQLLMAPYTMDKENPGLGFEKQPGVQCLAYILRPESQGSVMIRSNDPDDPPVIRPNYLSADYDRSVAVGIVRYIRKFFEQPALQPFIAEETSPGPQVESADEIIDAFNRLGGCGLHAVGTAKMGQDNLAVVDENLRVRGVTGLRVMDCGVMPTMASGNTNAPAMAMAWRAADLILS